MSLPTLAYRRIRGDIIETFKILCGHYDKEVCNIFTLYQDVVKWPGRCRGHSKKLYKQKPRLEVQKHFFSYRVCDTWNNLPESVINSESIKQFETRLDNFWKNQGIKYDFTKCIQMMKNTNELHCVDETAGSTFHRYP